MYGKFFASTFTGSMVGAGAHVFAVWGYVIANTRPDGYVELNPPILAAMIGCSVEEIESAILYLTSPDTRSRSKQHNGSRLIKEAPFLYLVPNYPDYRSIRDENDRREYMKNYMREYRAKDSVNVNVNSGKPPLAHTEAEAEAEVKEKDICRVIFDAWSQILGHPRARFDKKRRSRIHARLEDGFTVEDLKLVPHGVKKSPWHMGENPTHTRYDDIATVYRDADQVEKFLALARNGDTDYAEGCDICRNHPDRSQVSLKTYGWIFNTKTKQLEDCICKNGTAQRQG